MTFPIQPNPHYLFSYPFCNSSLLRFHGFALLRLLRLLPLPRRLPLQRLDQPGVLAVLRPVDVVAVAAGVSALPVDDGRVTGGPGVVLIVFVRGPRPSTCTPRMMTSIVSEDD